jgi:hypothetical protein
MFPCADFLLDGWDSFEAILAHVLALESLGLHRSYIGGDDISIDRPAGELFRVRHTARIQHCSRINVVLLVV